MLPSCYDPHPPLTACLLPAYCLSAACLLPTCYLPTAYLLPVGYLLAAYLLPAGHLPAACVLPVACNGATCNRDSKAMNSGSVLFKRRKVRCSSYKSRKRALCASHSRTRRWNLTTKRTLNPLASVAKLRRNVWWAGVSVSRSSVPCVQHPDNSHYAHCSRCTHRIYSTCCASHPRAQPSPQPRHLPSASLPHPHTPHLLLHLQPLLLEAREGSPHYSLDEIQ